MMEEQIKEFIQWGLQALLGGAVVYAAAKLSKITDSVDDLNKSIATILERTSWHEKELNKQDDRISSLETTNLEASKRGLRKKGS